MSATDFSDANLRWADFSGAEISNAYFTRAILRGANFSDADLTGTNFSDADVSEANFTNAIVVGVNCNGTNLNKANLSKLDLHNINFSNANLTEAIFSDANLFGADFGYANLSNAILRNTNLSYTDFRHANLQYANLLGATLIDTNFDRADISNCRIYGISAWNLKNLDYLKQTNLIITKEDEPKITVDNVEIAQFVYLLLTNSKLRDVINTIANKAVLILGRFNLPERKEILDGLRDKLREKGLVPIVFDFEKAVERDFTETIKVLAGMSLFVIADVTNPKSTPLELQAVVPDYMIPFVPIIQKDEKPFAMFVDLQNKYSWVLPVRIYENKDQLINNLEVGIIKPALEKHNELMILKNASLKMVNLSDFEPPK